MVGGFGTCGAPINLLNALGVHKPDKLTLVSNDCGLENWGIGLLIGQHQVKRMIASYLGDNKDIEK